MKRIKNIIILVLILLQGLTLWYFICHKTCTRVFVGDEVLCFAQDSNISILPITNSEDIYIFYTSGEAPKKAFISSNNHSYASLRDGFIDEFGKAPENLEENRLDITNELTRYNNIYSLGNDSKFWYEYKSLVIITDDPNFSNILEK